MRPPKAGSSARLKIRCSCRFPASSDGCARPAKMICTGGRRAVRIAASRAGSWKSTSAPTSPVMRRANPIVSVAGYSSVPCATSLVALAFSSVPPPGAAVLLARPAGARPLAREVDQVAAQPLARAPQVLVGHGREPCPPRVLVLVIAPVGPEITLDQHREVAGEPAGHVHAGDQPPRIQHRAGLDDEQRQRRRR